MRHKKGNQVLWQESPTNRKWVLPDSSWEFWSSPLNLTGAQDLYFLFSPLSFWVKPVLLRGYVDWWGKYSPRFSSGASQVSTSSGSIICIWCERSLCLFLEAKIHQGAGTKWQMGVKSPRGACSSLSVLFFCSQFFASHTFYSHFPLPCLSFTHLINIYSFFKLQH